MQRDAITPYLIPSAIVIGAVLIAGAVLFKEQIVPKSAPVAKVAPSLPAAPGAARLENVDAVRTEARHLYGSESAARTIVEFSDLECPFCARLHPTLKRVVDESNGTINWEYRHLPLPSHRNARAAAVASECVAKLTKPENFWPFVDVLLENIGKATPDFLLTEALKFGVSKTAYTQCLTDASIMALVDADLDKARELGGTGTPFSLIVDNETKSAQVVSGAVPYEEWQRLLTTKE